MNQSIQHYEWNWQLLSSPEKLWPLISDTNRLYHNLGFSPVQQADLSYDQKKEYLQLSYNSIQNSDAWEEEPYQWERPYRFGVKRRYRNGSCKEIRVQMDLFENDRGTRVRCQIWADPRNFISSIVTSLKFKTLYRNSIKVVLKEIDQLSRQNRQPYEIEHKKRLSRAGKKRLDEYRDILVTACHEDAIVSLLIDYISRAKDIELKRIEPFRIADWWSKPRDRVLAVFLHATKIGLLNFNWDLFCPECRTLQHSCKTLSEVHEPTLCKKCNRDFLINFNRSLQLSFKPNPLVRKISEAEYCLGGPHSLPHVMVKQLIKPGQQRYLKVHLEEGDYNLKISGMKGEALLKVTENGKDNIMVMLDRFGLNDEVAEISAMPNLVFENKTQQDQLFILEKAAWRDDIVTAARVTSFQLFRDLFDNEVLRKGEKISVDEQTLMFTDLLDSTGMYNKEGEEQAIGRVIEHFEILQNIITEENGAIVKTIGDSVMAVFSSPSKALKAFTRSHEILSKDTRFNKKLKLKAGIHHGSCMAVNLNNKIDYFGSTVNIASRLVDYAEENEVVISHTVASNDKISDLLNSSGSVSIIKDATAKLRGFDDEQFPIKKIALDKPALRLVI